MEPYEGREPYIFISYSHKDRERAEPFLKAVSGAGYRVWYDKGISAGYDWLKTLLEKVRDCAVFCPLFSEAFADSKYCAKETNYAIRKDKAIVPLYLEEMSRKDNWLVDFLGERQDLRLYQFDSPAQFAERLDGEQAFAPCKVPEWHKVGHIQWRLGADGVLSIARNEDLPEWFGLGSIPSYQHDPVHSSSTAPWAPYWDKILSVEITDNINAIGDYAFSDCKDLTKARIGNCVTAIGKGVFLSCANLMEVRIPDSVTKIGEGAFFGCNSLTDVRIPDSVTIIEPFAFAVCENLKSVEIPAGARFVKDSIGLLSSFDEHTLVTRRDASPSVTA